ncbi:DNA mismatch repair endonuclease MutL [Salipaludibacillus neizhouensis]|uniref:DNA mismatch repair protein MutL n=1 Tax=Salipaludibacillus neizhouensis TaxID=885475 RepID=A0A3A9KBR8_9BACI|nr:DNA mismatch repair endonuclease MutL [Salipaludibacillus neizhouensis]RKL69078.1 DNA mismatch repair endonuclease MutL [Salipaludibacillus neizhouensis]
MAKIFQLDELLSNKIAAGEVVERPSSVVKELVENAIDANSTQIRIDIEEGGLSLIRVLDDGDGLEKDDFRMAFFRHATSKIQHDADLFRIKTLGFRGEALPSIASVSKLTLKSSTGGTEGQEIRLEGGHVKHEKTATPRKGTEIIVTDLFYNTPARLKYLRTIHTELGHISDIINRMALSHPEIAFILTHNQKTLLQTVGNGDLARVIASIYGSAMAKKMVPIEAETLDFTLKGFIAKPEVTRSNRSYMSTILNGRYVKNYSLIKAIQEGYHTLLPIGKFPLVVLHVEMNPLLVDVNVHPSKLEVRISKEKALQELVTGSIKDVFKGIQLIPDVLERKYSNNKPNSEQMAFSFEHRAQSLNNQREKEETENAQESSFFQQPENDMTGEVRESDFQTINKQKAAEADIWELEREPVVEPPFSQESEESSQEGNVTKANVPVLYPIGQLHGTYIMAQNDQGLYMVDQHAAQERIKYEYFRDKLSLTNNQLQELLVPLQFEFTQSEESLMTEYQKELEDVGLFLEPFGSRTYIVRSHPTWFPEGQEEEVISEMLEQLRNEQTIHIGKLREEAAILMSCKAAIKANRHLTKDEMFQLLETLRTCEDPYTCPHGRPILIHYSTYDIEKMFKRIM